MSDLYSDLSTLSCELECVTLEVEKHLLETMLVSAHKVAVRKPNILDRNLDFLSVNLVLLNLNNFID